MDSLPPSVRQLYARSATGNQQERPHCKHDLRRGTPTAAQMAKTPAPATQEHPQLPLSAILRYVTVGASETHRIRPAAAVIRGERCYTYVRAAGVPNTHRRT